MSQPTLSVVIPTYNYGHFLGQALASVFAQTRLPQEVVVVDDGSTDGTAERVRTLPGRFRYIRRENQGPAAARNCGMAETSGELIAFLDPDDLWLPRFLERAANRLQSSPEAFGAGSNVCEFDALGEREHPASESFLVNHGGDIFRDLAMGRFLLPSASVLRRSAVTAVGGHDPRFKAVEDWDLALRLAARQPFEFLPEVLVRRRVHPSNLSHQRTFRPLLQQRAVLEKVFGDPVVRRRGWRLRREAIAEYYRRLASDEYTWGRRGPCLQAAARAVMFWPANRLAWGLLARCCMGEPAAVNLKRVIGRP